MSASSPPVQRRRLVAAVAIVVAIVASVPVADAVMRNSDAQTGARASSIGIRAGELLATGDENAVLDRVEEIADRAGADVGVPSWFSAEIGFLPGACEVRSTEGGAVVGYTVAGESTQVAIDLEGHMSKRGWTGVSLGGTEGATFVKKSGECRWALATCTQVGSSTCVVIRGVKQ